MFLHSSLLPMIISEKGGRYMYLIQIDGAQKFSVCTCINFLIQVLQQKSAHVLFLMGWYVVFGSDYSKST